MNRALGLAALAFGVAVAMPAVAQRNASVYPFPECPAGYPTTADMLDELVDNGPSAAGDVWITPSSIQRNNLITGIHQMLNSPQTARIRLQNAGMDICLAKSSSSAPSADTYVVYDPDGLSAATSVGLPVLLYRPATTAANPNQPLVVLSIPHAKTEGHLADYFTVEAMNWRHPVSNEPIVRAAVVSTAHRCHANTALDPNGPSADYIGSVTVSGCNGKMRLSDDAHNAESLLQAMHQELRRQFWDDMIVQVHGSGSDFPGISVSNGSSDQYNGPEDDSAHAVVGWFRTLGELYEHMDDLTVCHQYTLGVDEIRNADYFGVNGRKCGTRNATRGEDPRLPIDAAPIDPDDRRYHFLHLEVNSGLKDTQAERALIIETLESTLGD
ncbi:MAG TPA: hypothetical protein VIT22_06870 [Pseudoxanthomonas sp.]